jgi:hypothetical protein
MHPHESTYGTRRDFSGHYAIRNFICPHSGKIDHEDIAGPLPEIAAENEARRLAMAAGEAEKTRKKAAKPATTKKPQATNQRQRIKLAASIARMTE